MVTMTKLVDSRLLTVPNSTQTRDEDESIKMHIHMQGCGGAMTAMRCIASWMKKTEDRVGWEGANYPASGEGWKRLEASAQVIKQYLNSADYDIMLPYL